MTKYVMALGNVVAGFKFYGPFDSNFEARDYALHGPDMVEEYEWTIAPLSPPPETWTATIDRTRPRCLWCGQEDHTDLGRHGQGHLDIPNPRRKRRT